MVLVITKTKIRIDYLLHLYSERINMNHFSSRLTSPLLSICAGYVYIAILATFFYFSGFYNKSTFFSWGPPINFMGTKIVDDMTYYLLLFLFFLHQLINNWVNDVTYPWMLNCIQDPKSKHLVYSKGTSMLIVNMFALYSELDVVLIVSGIMSQLSFFGVLILANMVAVSFINWQYIKNKEEKEDALLTTGEEMV